MIFIKQNHLCFGNWDTIFLNQFIIAGFKEKTMNIRTKHADIFHYKCFWFKFENCTDVLFYQLVILTNHMILLAICIRKALAGRSSDDNVDFTMVALYLRIISCTHISLNIDIRMIRPVCFLHIWAILKCHFNFEFLCLFKTEA